MSKVKFIEDTHQYLTEDGRELISVSAFTERFKPKVDWKAVAKKVAAKKTKAGEPTTTEEILKKWEEKRDLSAKIGTIFHSIKEEELLGQENPIFYNTPCSTKECLYTGTDKWSIPINKLENNTVYPELMIYDIEHMICGQSDKVIVANNKINIWDYKGLALDTIIPTETGFKLMADIQVGDRIFDGEGILTSVKHISEIHYNPCYRVFFDTGDSIVCDHEHKWEISHRLSKGKYKDLEKRTDELFSYFGKGKPIRIKCNPLVLPKIELPIDPYILGVWLGDGNSHAGRITNMNPNLWIEIEKRGYTLGKDISGGSSGKAQDKTIFGLETQLTKLGLLKNKHIPDIYLRGSYEQRLDLLRGFMDTDGSWNRRRKRCVMVTTREWQANGISEIVSSLGWKPTIVKAKTSGFGKNDIPCFHINFDAGENPFLTRNKDYKPNNKEKSKYRYVKEIRMIETVPTRCISVDSPTHTYLTTRNYIKTHNTDAEIKFKAFSSQWVKPQKLLGPLAHLDDCNANIYSIKMSLYMYLLWRANRGTLRTGDIMIEHVHLERDEDGLPILEDGKPIVKKIEQIQLPYRKKEVMDMLATLKVKA